MFEQRNLAGSGRRVLVLEAAQRPGGAARTRHFAEGFSVSAGAQFLTMLHPEIRRDLRLESHGLAYAAHGLKTVSLSPDGEHVTLSGPRAEGASLSVEDRSEYAIFHQQMLRKAEQAMDSVPLEEREVGGVAVRLTRPQVQHLKKRLYELRQEILQLDGAGDGEQAVHHFAFQLFPLTTWPEGDEA